jgi:hypothetical protein
MQPDKAVLTAGVRLCLGLWCTLRLNALVWCHDRAALRRAVVNNIATSLVPSVVAVQQTSFASCAVREHVQFVIGICFPGTRECDYLARDSSSR